ncbi:MAG: response regulator [Bacteroidales bacterium]|nr:response regulator [Bacteroidales bacterium]
MIVDDAVVVRGLVSRWLAEETGVEVVASLRNGREAVDQFSRYDPDVVVLDIEMPELDGISTLPLLLEKKRDLIVIMASTLTRRNAEISLKALSLGAADYLPKPESNRDVTTSTTFRRELVDMLALRQRDGQVGRADEDAVDAGHRQDVVKDVQRLARLDHDDRQRHLVGAVQVVVHLAPEQAGRTVRPPAALPLRRYCNKPRACAHPRWC